MRTVIPACCITSVLLQLSQTHSWYLCSNTRRFSNSLRLSMASDTRPPDKREKVALKKGFHLMDWVKLTRVATDLSGLKGEAARAITMEELSQHNTRFDCWTAYNKKVYNITPYLPYHPGGEEILMQAAGKDCTELFVKYHRWVNAESMIGKCLVGTLVDTNVQTIAEGDEEEESDIGKGPT